MDIDDIITKLWLLDADLVENNLSKDEIREKIHEIANNLEDIIDVHDLWHLSEKSDILNH